MTRPFAVLLILVMAFSGAPARLLAEELTPQKEKEIGWRFHLKLAASGALVDDPPMLGYLKSVSDRVLKGAGLKPGQFSFHIIQSGGINAFAVPGGYIYINTETLYSLENEGQLAAILAHETAHVAARHFARRLEASSAFSVASVAAILAGALAASRGGASAAALGQALMLGGTGAGAQSLLANSRDNETEADAKGRGYLVKAGYNPRDMYGAFKILQSKTYQLSPDTPTYLTTHPALTSRLASSFNDAEKAAPAAPDYRYLAFRDRVMAGCGETQRAQSVFTRRLNSDSRDHSALHGLGLLAQRRQSLRQADQFMSQALNLSPGNGEYLADLGDLALKSRRLEDARKYYEKAGPHNRLAVLGLARTLDLLDDKAKAGPLYDQAAVMEPEDYPLAWELAGRFFGRTGRLDKGHYYLARYFAASGNIDQALFHYQEAAAPGGQFRAQAERDLQFIKEIKKDDRQ